jgi:hypothetical protein
MVRWVKGATPNTDGSSNRESAAGLGQPRALVARPRLLDEAGSKLGDEDEQGPLKDVLDDLQTLIRILRILTLGTRQRELIRMRGTRWWTSCRGEADAWLYAARSAGL